MEPMPPTLPYKISVLVFLENGAGRLLLIRRAKAPNRDCWSPIGGKLEMATGESPFECAARETEEETGFRPPENSLHCFGYVAEKAYEGDTHWLMFLFHCREPLPGLPTDIDEGRFAFFDREEIDGLNIPPSDRALVWPWYDTHRERFVAMRANCATENGEPEVVVEMEVG